MGQRRRALRPIVEPVESRALLSAGFAGASAAQAIVSPSLIRSIRLHGRLRGQYQANTPNPDAGTTYTIQATGHVGGFGLTSLTGAMHSLGFVAQDYAQGDLSLKSTKGTITLHLTALVEQTGFQPLPQAFSYRVTGGTGRYSGANGVGSATLTLIPRLNSPPSIPAKLGRFALDLTPQVLPL